MITTKLAAAALAGTLGVAITGAAALAAVEPSATTATSAAVTGPEAGSLQAEKGKPADKIKKVLDGLVAKGTITQAQEDAILSAFKDAAEDHREKAKAHRVEMDLLKVSADFIGLPKDQLRAQLKAGKSLAQIATDAGKTRDALIANDVGVLSAQIDKRLADGKITRDEADKLKAHLTERVTKFVDHTFTGPKPRT